MFSPREISLSRLKHLRTLFERPAAIFIKEGGKALHQALRWSEYKTWTGQVENRGWSSRHVARS